MSLVELNQFLFEDQQMVKPGLIGISHSYQTNSSFVLFHFLHWFQNETCCLFSFDETLFHYQTIGLKQNVNLKRENFHFFDCMDTKQQDWYQYLDLQIQTLKPTCMCFDHVTLYSFDQRKFLYILKQLSYQYPTICFVVISSDTLLHHLSDFYVPIHSVPSGYSKEVHGYIGEVYRFKLSDYKVQLMHQ